MKISSVRCLSGNVLKIIAAICMVIDHMGILFFPTVIACRYIGRLAYPIFAFMIAEGAKYTKNKLKYLGMISGLALICQLVYYFAMDDLYMCILVTFSLSIVTIYALQYLKKCLFASERDAGDIALAMTLFALTVAMVYVTNMYLEIDYGFYGCMAPVFVSLFDFRGIDAPEKLKRLDNHYVRLAMLGIGVLAIWFPTETKQDILFALFSLSALIPLFFYSEKRGKLNMKYFFYIFYPLHLVALQGIQFLINNKG